MTNVLKKIKEFFKSLFGKSDALMLKEKNTVSNACSENKSNESISNKRNQEHCAAWQCG